MPLAHRLRNRTLSLLPLAAISIAILIPSTLAAQTAAAPSLATLRKDFLNPPNEDRPLVRWWWFGPAVVKPEILRELQQMKADGIQGAELAFVYAEELDDPAKGINNLPFLSPEMLDDVSYAETEGRKLGLRIDVTLCSGWPYGGPATPLSQAVTRLRIAEVPVAANVTAVNAPALQEGESYLSAIIAEPAKAGAPAAPAGRGGRGGGPRPPSFDASTAQPLTLTGSTAAVAGAATPRVAVFFLLSHTKQQVKRAAVGAEGWVLDPFSHDAVATHLKAVGEPLVKAFGANPPYAIFSDSLEAYGADWTPNLPAEFKKRRGYDLMPHLPELVAGGTPAAENVRHDYGKTLTELVNENYLTQINDWAIAHHTKFRSQTYGEPAVSFSSQNLVGLAEGEGPQWRSWSTLRWATSANHVFNHTVTSGETFTWLHSPVFRATPLDMKTEADIDFIMGENQIVCHGWPYSPPQAFYPGWSLYAAANFNDNNPWHPVMPSVTAYIGRMSYLMRQGKPANQVAILLPTDDVWADFRPTQTTVTGGLGPHIAPLMSPILSAGYNVDYIDAEAIEKVGLGTHQVLVIPRTKRMPLEALKKIESYAAAGGHVISIGDTPMMEPNKGKTDPEFLRLTSKFYMEGASTDTSTAKKNSIHIADESQLADALHKAVAPDLKLADGQDAMKDQLGFIRRKLPTADIYFVANTSNEAIDTTVSFGTSYKAGEAWDPDSGVATPATPASQSIHLAPYESRVFVFDASAAKATPAAASKQVGYSIGAKEAIYSQLADLSSDWKVNFVDANKTVTETTPTDWLADPSTKNYSGEAIYSRDFTLAAASTAPVYLEVEGGKPLPGSPNSPPDHPALGPDGLPDPRVTRAGPGMHAYYDPPIREAALVTINGQPAGALWHPPYRLDVSKFLKPGQNHIEIHVYNTRLNAWAALPPHDYKPLIAKYGDKFQVQDLQLVQPVSSGLLGPVHLVTAESK